MKWVVNKIILSFLKFLRIDQICLLALVSSPLVGSSNIINLEFPINAMPAVSLLLYPPDRLIAS